MQTVENYYQSSFGKHYGDNADSGLKQILITKPGRVLD